MKGSSNSNALLLQESRPDEIDSVVEFVAEYCLNFDDDFSDTDFDDVPDDLKTNALLKDYLLPESLAFLPPAYSSGVSGFSFSCLFINNWSEIDSPPPKFLSV
ncbi:MAG TPA: hypothetical protein VK927_08605 [Adhaeribacter sp.]|nr:hypothetical protein [Adhaeribacter sp.]